MIETDENIQIQPDTGRWRAQHDSETFGGPDHISLADDCLIRDCTFYLDNCNHRHAVVKKQRASRKAGTAIVLSEGYFPFGRNLSFRQTCRYAANHVRVTLDFNWTRDTEVKRHLGIGTLFLPGQWESFFEVPPLLHICEGKLPEWHKIPAADEQPIMIGHWHRPPLSLVFRRPDGTRVEIGTGSDIWRWEKSLGHGPESGSYKIYLEKEGIRFIREPLMCCDAYRPGVRQYRFSWYAAWCADPQAAADGTKVSRQLHFDADNDLVTTDVARRVGEVECLHLDLRDWQPQPDWLHSVPFPQIDGSSCNTVCWQASGVQKQARRIVRQLAAAADAGNLVLAGVTPGGCYEPSHIGRANVDRLAHWDINGLLDFSTWARQQLGVDWQISAPQDGFWQELPVLQGLFDRNGFEVPL